MAMRFQTFIGGMPTIELWFSVCTLGCLLRETAESFWVLQFFSLSVPRKPNFLNDNSKVPMPLASDESPLRDNGSSIDDVMAPCAACRFFQCFQVGDPHHSLHCILNPG